MATKYSRPGGRKAMMDSRPVSDDEYDTPDNLSVVSGLSDDKSSAAEEACTEIAEVEEISGQEVFEEKLKECIDGTTEKSAKGRQTSLEGIHRALCKKYLYEFLIDRKETITDCIGRCLKKGRGDEQVAAAKCVSVMCIQLGQEAEFVLSELRPVLSTVLCDNSTSLKARSQCAIALALSTFIASTEMEHITTVMETLYSQFKASYRKGDKTIPSHSPDMCTFHAAALGAWSLLLSITPTSTAEKMVLNHLPRMSDLLQSSGVDLRIVAGETIALMYELAREEDEDFEGDGMDDLCEILKQLATDGNKYRAKKDRRQQRSSFRDILRAVEAKGKASEDEKRSKKERESVSKKGKRKASTSMDMEGFHLEMMEEMKKTIKDLEGDVPELSIRFSKETLFVDSWVRKWQYNTFCAVLGPGMNCHLQENDLIRDVFGLGAPIPIDKAAATQKVSRFERHQYNAAAFKARTKARAKNRDKRAVTVNGGAY